MSTIIQQIPDYIEFNGRIETSLEYFEDMNMDNNLIAKMNKKYDKTELLFEKIDFENVSFRYSSELPLVMENFNMDISTIKNKIIGITGLSGKGKSTFAKLILKLHYPTTGKIYIDGRDIEDIDTDYIRENITYVNQNSKLFDRKIIDNFLYGCTDPDQCKDNLQEVMKYTKIRDLYKNVDIYEKNAGSLGENLSGGQRMIVNVVGGLINPSKILILDEPTNALDPELKRELIAVIRDFKKYKQSIIIISHDKECFALFDEKIQI
jgi:ABC-type bacteriocin/lantibiotic exporter with double-glycine peptidase domain